LNQASNKGARIGERQLPALITGASSGIGADLARVFARNGHPLALTARDGGRLDQLAGEIREEHGMDVITAVSDLARPGGPELLKRQLEDAHFTTGILVNNAGFGLNGSFGELDRGQVLELLDLNVRALTELSHLFLPDIVGTRGAILNVASVASFFPGPGMAAYYASKAYVLSLSEALAVELKDAGMRVSALCPGPTRSGFARRAGIPSRGEASYTMDSLPVAELGYAGLMWGTRVIVPGWSNRTVRMASWILPHVLSMRGIARIQLRRQLLRRRDEN